MTSFTPDQWIILGLVFVLGLLVGMWMTSGGRRKWKTRYNEELEQRRTLEKQNKERESHWADREKEWRHQESLHASAMRDRDGRNVDHRDRPVMDRDRDRDGYRDGPRGDMDRDGVRDSRDRSPTDDRRS